MNNKCNKLVWLYPLWVWFIPFAGSFFFFSKDNVLLVNQALFASIITSVFFIVFVFFLAKLMCKDGLSYEDRYKHGIGFAVTVVIVNLILDYIFIVKLFGESWSELLLSTLPVYIAIIPLSYIVIKYFVRK